MTHPLTMRQAPGWFQRELAVIDPSLAVRWCERQQRWQIMRLRTTEYPSARAKRDITEGSWYRYECVYRVENPDGSYRELDRRILTAMRQADAAHRDWRDMLRQLERQEAQQEKDRQRPLDDRRHEMALELRKALTGTYTSGYGGTVVQQARSRTKEGHSNANLQEDTASSP